MKEDAAARAAKYLDATSQSLQHLKTKKLPSTVSEKEVNQVLELIRGYSRDAKHYSEHQKPVTSLACIAYAEGLLDAMKFLGLVDLENPPEKTSV
jgi:FAD synthetase